MLGDKLLAEGLITHQQLEKALEEQKRIKEKLGEFNDVIMLSSQFGFGVERLLNSLKEYMIDDCWY